MQYSFNSANNQRENGVNLFFSNIFICSRALYCSQWKSCFCARANARARDINKFVVGYNRVVLCVDNFYWLTFTCYVYNVFNGKIKIMIEYWIVFLFYSSKVHISMKPFPTLPFAFTTKCSDQHFVFYKTQTLFAIVFTHNLYAVFAIA